MFRRLIIVLAFVVTAITVAPEPGVAASKEILELQRDLAQLQQQVQQLQQAQEKNFAQVLESSRTAGEAANRVSSQVAVIQDNIRQSLRDQQEKVVTPVVGLSTRMDSLSADLRTVTQAVADLNQNVAQLKSQLSDLTNAVKVIGTPAPPPPGPSSTTGGSATLPSSVMVPPAATLYDSAKNDLQGGNLDVAQQEFSDYLKYYGNTDNAPEAQYYIAQIHYSKGNYDAAANEFDMVLEKYPEFRKTKDAMYYKGLSLVKAGRRSQGHDEFVELITRYPHTDQANQACTQIIALGLHCPAAGSPAKSAPKKKKG